MVLKEENSKKLFVYTMKTLIFLMMLIKLCGLLSQEREYILKELALYILKCLDKRNVDRILKHDKQLKKMFKHEYTQ